MILFLFILACSDPPDLAKPIKADWRPVEPPHSGLKCWRTLNIGHGGVIYCEPDSTATHGASP